MDQENAAWTAGAMLLAVAFSSGLYGCVIVQIHTYYASLSTSKITSRDSIWLCYLVGIVGALETGSTIAMIHSVWVRVVDWYTISALQYGLGPWTSALCPVFSCLVASIVQIFLARRIWCLSGATRKSKSGTIALVIVLIAVAEEALSLYCTVKILHGYLDPLTATDVANATMAYLVLALTCDLIITSTITILLWRAKSTITGALSNLLKSLIFKCLQNGFLVALTVSLALFLSFNNSSTRLSMILIFSLSRLYAMTLLASLNGRKRSSSGGTEQDHNYSSTF